MIPIADYMKISTPMPPYLPYPRFLLEMNLTQTAKLVYTILLGRTVVSKSHGWADDEGRIYANYPIAEIADTIDRSLMTVKNALSELESSGLIERKRQGNSMPNRIYVKLADGQDIVRQTDKKLAPQMDRKLHTRQTENYVPDGQEIMRQMDKKPSTNKIKSKHKSKKERERGAHAVLGRYKNVLLTDDEYRELSMEIPELDRLIEELSSYMKSNGKDYADHAATLRRWAEAEKAKSTPKQYSPDYSCEEGESL